ncbi:MAG TPA: isoprenylcysteine carboxylmethyltransferase family protein [Caulobacteraceae bacterium]|jgi:protein-S-isoprenylcysteine O-methyltransferase Ste14
MAEDLDRPNRVPWPPLLLLGVVIAAVALSWLAPLPLGRLWPALRIAGGGLAAAGLILVYTARAQFSRAGTPVDPTGRATALSVDGVYRFSRNPMYLGASMFLGGVGLAWPAAWLLILTLPLPVLLQKLAIEREERYLSARFGAEYDAFCARTPRWFGPL